LDGKWLPGTSDLTLTPDDLAAAHKQLLAVGRGWRDLIGALGLRAVFHHRGDHRGRRRRPRRGATAIAITTCGRSVRWSFEWPNVRVPDSTGPLVPSSSTVWARSTRSATSTSQ
jgi:hypothetical protein